MTLTKFPYRILAIIIVLFFSGQLANANLNALQVMDKVTGKLTSSPSMKIAFTIKSSGGNVNGSLTMAKDKFKYSAADQSVWYNGKYQWVRVGGDSEVSLTEPTANELLEVNPFAVITNYKKNYNAKLLPSTKGTYKVELTSRIKGSWIKSAVITVSSSDYTPISIDCMVNKGTLKIKINSIVKGKALPASFFTFNAKDYPGVEINDLR